MLGLFFSVGSNANEVFLIYKLLSDVVVFKP